MTSHILVWAVITPSCLFHFLLLLLHFRLCVQSFLWNPLPRIAEQHLRLCPTPEGSESESPSVCRPLTLRLWRSEGMTEIWPEFMTWILQLSLPSASAFSPDASTTWFWAAMFVTVVVDDRCAALWLCYSSSGPFRRSGGAAGMTEFTAEPSGGVVGKTQWNICEGRCQHDDTLASTHHHQHLPPPLKHPATTQPGLTAPSGPGAQREMFPKIRLITEWRCWIKRESIWRICWSEMSRRL